jgi:hypothetical protein
MGAALLWDKDLESRGLLSVYTLLAGVVSLWSIVVNARSSDERFCYDNAINNSQVLLLLPAS